MICKKCGTRFSDGMFCPECGASTMPAMGMVGEPQINTWEAALEYSEEEGYNKKMYGPQGELEEQRIGEEEIKIDAGGKKVFENKILLFERGKWDGYNIKMKENTKVEFRNCVISEKVRSGKYNSYREPIVIYEENVSVSLIFENCLIKGNEKLVSGLDLRGLEMEFRNCAFDGGQMCKDSDPLVGGAKNVYFENCFFKERFIADASKIKFRNCVIIKELDSLNLSSIDRNILMWGREVVFENCFIRSKMKLVGRCGIDEQMMIIKNSYFDDYSCILKDDRTS